MTGTKAYTTSTHEVNTIATTTAATTARASSSLVAQGCIATSATRSTTSTSTPTALLGFPDKVLEGRAGIPRQTALRRRRPLELGVGPKRRQPLAEVGERVEKRQQRRPQHRAPHHETPQFYGPGIGRRVLDVIRVKHPKNRGQFGDDGVRDFGS